MTRANDAVEDNTGTACEEDKTAGTVVALVGLDTSRVPSPVPMPVRVSTPTLMRFRPTGVLPPLGPAGVERAEIGLRLSTFSMGFRTAGGDVGNLGFLGADASTGDVSPVLAFGFVLVLALAAKRDATWVTLPPLPPRADRTSYFTSGSTGFDGKRGGRPGKRRVGCVGGSCGCGCEGRVRSGVSDRSDGFTSALGDRDTGGLLGEDEGV